MKRRASVLLLLLISLFAAGVPTAFGQMCATPPPTYTPTPGYRATIAAAAPANLLVYFPLNETSGTTAEDESGNNADGTYNGASVGAGTFLTGDHAPSFDGVNDNVNIYTSFLNTNFNHDELTVSLWFKATAGAGYWTDGLTSFLINLAQSTSNRVIMAKLNTNPFRWGYTGSATVRSIDRTPTPTGWVHVAITCSKIADLCAAYLNGVQIGTIATLPVWNVAGLLNTTTVIGSSNTSGAQPFPGNIAQVAIWKSAFNATQVAYLATIDPTTIPPPTATICPTYTYTPSPTWTPTFTPTFTPTPTPTHTPNILHFWTVPAPVGTSAPGATGTPTPAPGRDVVFVTDFNAGQVAISMLLALIIASLIIIWLLLLVPEIRVRYRVRRPRNASPEETP